MKGSIGTIRQEMINGVLAGIYRDMGEPALAKKHYEKAIELNRTTQDAEEAFGMVCRSGETYQTILITTMQLKAFLKLT